MRILTILIVLLLAGCASKAHYSGWPGQHVDTLLSTWGPPKRSAQLSDGRSVYTYESLYCRVNMIIRADGLVDRYELNPPATVDTCFTLSTVRPFPPPPGS